MKKYFITAGPVSHADPQVIIAAVILAGIGHAINGIKHYTIIDY